MKDPRVRLEELLGQEGREEVEAAVQRIQEADEEIHALSASTGQSYIDLVLYHEDENRVEQPALANDQAIAIEQGFQDVALLTMVYSLGVLAPILAEMMPELDEQLTQSYDELVADILNDPERSMKLYTSLEEFGRILSRHDPQAT